MVKLSDIFGYFQSRPVLSEEKPKSIDAATSAAASSPAETSPAMQMPPTPDPSAPIQFENFSREFQQVTHQDSFDGFRLEAGKAVTKYLQASHSLFLGTSLRETGYIYQFGPTFQSEDGSTALMGRVGIDGSVNGRIIKRLSKGLELKANVNSSLKEEQRNMYELSGDATGSDWASSVKLAWQGTCILNGAFSQVVTPRLQAGGEMTYVAANGATIGALGLRYAHQKNIFNAQVSRQPDFKSGGMGPQIHGVKANLIRKVTDRLSLGAECEVSHPDQESALRLAYEYTFRVARVQGTLDTGGKVSVFIQDMSGFGLSGMIDYWKGDYKFGFLMHMMPQEGGGPGGPGPL